MQQKKSQGIRKGKEKKYSKVKEVSDLDIESNIGNI